MALRGVRGAIVTAANTSDSIVSDTTLLLQELFRKNSIDIESVASIFFSVTQDLNADFPAVAARRLGYSYTPLFCMTEIPVPGSLKPCIRVLIHLNSDVSQKEIKHCYLKGAEILRPDHSGK